MLNKTLPANKNFLLGAILTGLIISVFALAPQIDLWLSCENQCHGIYAITDIDEPFYAAYLQSLMDGKPRRNSPFSSAVDSPQTPQKEAGLYIQFLAAYPLAFLGKLFNLSISQLMILTSLLAGFASALAIYWLVFLFTDDPLSAFVGALSILFLGATVGGQGTTFSLISSEGPHLQHNLIFLRRIVPAMGFPAMFLFIAFVWQLIKSESQSAKLKSAVLAFCAFTFCVYSYFYFWTTTFAWFFALISLLAFFDFETFKKNLKHLMALSFSLALILLPYFFLLSNREVNTDSVLALDLTHQPDFWQIPELFSYATTALILIFAKFGLISLKDKKIIFLLSINLVTVIVFNQQIITGRSIQPFHYLFYCVNYFVTFSTFSLIFIILKQLIELDRLKLLLLVLVSIPLIIGGFDTFYSTSIVLRDLNLKRNSLMPVAERIKTISQNKEIQVEKPKGAILSFDFIDKSHFNGIEIPALTSQPILWGPHLFYLPDIHKTDNIKRLNTFLYYQSVSKKQLKSDFFSGMAWEAYGYFGAERMSKIQTGKDVSIKPQEVDEIVNQYGNFAENFNYQDAQNLLISMVLVNKKVENDFTNLDRWYQRDEGEMVGDYILYQVKLRPQ